MSEYSWFSTSQTFDISSPISGKRKKLIFFYHSRYWPSGVRVMNFIDFSCRLFSLYFKTICSNSITPMLPSLDAENTYLPSRSHSNELMLLLWIPSSLRSSFLEFISQKATEPSVEPDRIIPFGVTITVVIFPLWASLRCWICWVWRYCTRSCPYLERIQGSPNFYLKPLICICF